MASSGMLRRVDLVRTDASEVLSAFFIRVTRIGELGTTLNVTSNDARCEEIPLQEIPPAHLVFLHSVRRSLATASVVPSSSTFVTLIIEALSFSEASVLTRATRRKIPEYAIIHLTAYRSEQFENIRSRASETALTNKNIRGESNC
jgi:hypothetical protein